MNNDEISRIIENLDEDLIKSAEEKRAAAMLDSANADIKSKKRRAFIKIALGSVTAIAACAAMAIGALSWLKTVNIGPDVVKNTGIPVVSGEDIVSKAPDDGINAGTPAVTDDNVVTSVPEDNTVPQAPSDTVQNSVTKKTEDSTVTKASSDTVSNSVTKKPNTDNKTEKPSEKDEIVELPPQGSSSPIIVTAACYPKMAKYPDETASDYFQTHEVWWEDTRARLRAAAELNDGLFDFYKTSSNEFLKSAKDENLIYSPVNVYMALAMLAETTDGESRMQILRLLDTESIESLREQTALMWKANYRNDGATTSILANSLWLSDKTDFNKNTLDTLANDYFASTYKGTMGSKEINEALRSWLNEQTGGLLDKYVDKVELNPSTIMSIVSTVYFRAKWDIMFNGQFNETKVFHSPAGDIDKEFMKATDDFGTYFVGSDYGAIHLNFTDGGMMWLILPDEDKTVDDLLSSGEYLDMVASGGKWANKKQLIIHYSVPKFDVSSEIKLKNGLRAMGVTDVFKSPDADFSPITKDNDGLYLSEVKHCARVTIDEEGCTAAAFTKMSVDGAALPLSNEMDFIVDRPFIFVIDNGSGQPLFVGVVNDP